jgi:hypothetical protein
MGCLQASRKDETMRGSTGVADTAGEGCFLPLPVGLRNTHQAVSPVGWTNSSRLGTENKDWFAEFHGARFLVPCRNRCDELAAERCLQSPPALARNEQRTCHRPSVRKPAGFSVPAKTVPHIAHRKWCSRPRFCSASVHLPIRGRLDSGLFNDRLRTVARFIFVFTRFVRRRCAPPVQSEIRAHRWCDPERINEEAPALPGLRASSIPESIA